MADEVVDRLKAAMTTMRMLGVPASTVHTVHAGIHEIVRLRAEVERLTDEMSTMHRTVVHDCCVDVQSERALADQLAEALRLQHAVPASFGIKLNAAEVKRHALAAYEAARKEEA